MNKKNTSLRENANLRVTRNNTYKNEFDKNTKKNTSSNQKESSNSMKRPGLLDPNPTPSQKKKIQNNMASSTNKCYDYPKKTISNFNSVKMPVYKNENINKNNLKKKQTFCIDKTYMTPMQNFDNQNGQAAKSDNSINNANPRFHHNFFNQNANIMKKNTTDNNTNFNRNVNNNNGVNGNDRGTNYVTVESKSQVSKKIIKPQSECDTIIITCCINDMLAGFMNITHLKLFEIFGKITSAVVKNDQGFMEYIMKDSSGSVNCVFYNNDEVNVKLNRSHKYRCVGHARRNDKRALKEKYQDEQYYHCICIRVMSVEENKIEEKIKSFSQDQIYYQLNN